MPAKKTSRRKARRPAPRRKPVSSQLLKALAAIVVLSVIVAGALVAAWFWSQAEPDRTTAKKARPRTESPAIKSLSPEREATPKSPGGAVHSPAGGTERPPRPVAPPEVVPERPKPPSTPPEESDSLHASLPPTPAEPPALRKLPRVAIIIDDLGYDRHLAEKLMDLNAPLTFAILPHSPHQQAVARMAQSRGLEIMLHLPMEPMEYPEIDPGPGTLLASMSPDELLRVLEEDLRAVPQARGVNNHMGSRLTTHSEQLYQVFSLLKRRGLFFVDSRTTDESVCKPSARLLQIPFTQRDVFLDHVHDPAFIRKQIRELVRIARLKGEAVGIGHPNATTYTVLKEEIPTLRQQVDLVPVSRLARVVG